MVLQHAAQRQLGDVLGAELIYECGDAYNLFKMTGDYCVKAGGKGTKRVGDGEAV